MQQQKLFLRHAPVRFPTGPPTALKKLECKTKKAMQNKNCSTKNDDVASEESIFAMQLFGSFGLLVKTTI